VAAFAGVFVNALITAKLDKKHDIVSTFRSKSVGQPRACSSSQMMQMQQCYSTMMSYYNITNTPPFPSYYDFVTIRGNTLLYGGVPAMIRACNYEREMETCLAPLVSDCIDPDVYQTVLNTNDTFLARDWYTDYYVFQYECGAGFQELLRNFYCLESVNQYHYPELNRCLDTLINNTDSPDFGCGDYNRYIDCLVNIYAAECGPMSQHFICMVERVGISVNVPDCESQLMDCQYGSSTPFPMTSMMPKQQSGVRIHGGLREMLMERMRKRSHHHNDNIQRVKQL